MRGELAFEIDDNRPVLTGDKVVQIVARNSLKPRILQINHHPLLSGYPGSLKLFRISRNDLYWPSSVV